MLTQKSLEVFKLHDSVENNRASRVETFLHDNKPATPVLVMDLDRVSSKYRELRYAMPQASVFYAVKANPISELIDRLAQSDCQFDVASEEEIRLCLASGVAPDRLSFGNTIKKRSAIKFAHQVGIRLFAADSEAEIRKIADAAPGAKVSIRLLTSGAGAQWPLSRKFGCSTEMAADLLRLAQKLGLKPHGLSFHVGSQQTDPNQWDAPIAESAALFRDMREEGIILKLLNLGGGFPASYRENVPDLHHFARVIELSIDRHFGPHRPEIAIEPGRCLVAEAGVIETEVILISQKSADGARWVYLDCGKFGGLAETMDEAIQYPIEAVGRSSVTTPVIIAGPTCDSVDILYENAGYQLPVDLQEGDRIRIASTGSYTHSYASVGFNGFSPLSTICI